MAQFSAGPGGTFTPATTNDNWTLMAGNASLGTAGNMGKVKSFSWGGRQVSSVGYRTRWCRPTTDPTGAATAFTNGQTSPRVASLLTCASTFATTQPTLPADPAGNLFAQDWNLQGGGGAITLPIGGEWFVVNSATIGHGFISCRNAVGTDANLSNYTVTWEE